MRSMPLILLMVTTVALGAAAPDAPTGLSAVATGASGEVRLSWSPVTVPSVVTGYHVYHASAPFVGLAATPDYVTSTGTVQTALSDGQRRYFWVASDEAGVGPGPVGLSVSAVPYAPPDAPVLSGSPLPYGAGVSLSWPVPAAHGWPLGAIRLESSTGGDYAQLRSLPPGLSSTVQSLPCGVGVSLRARAVDALGNSSAPSSALELSYPCPPVLHSVSMDGGALALSWTPALSTASLPAEYHLVRATASVWSDPLPESVTITGAFQLSATAAAPAAGESRWYRLHTVDAAGVTSAASNQVALLAPPSGLQASGGRQRVRLQWARPTVAQARGLTSYQVYYATFPALTPFDAGTSVSVVADSGSGALMAVTLSSLANGQAYWFAVASQGGSGTAAVGYASLTVSAAASLPSPDITALDSLSGTALSLTWTAVDVEGNTPASYLVYRATDSALSGLALVTQTASTHAYGLALPVTGTPSFYFVAVSDASGATSTLAPEAASLLFAPVLGTPSLTTTAVANGRVALSWSSVPWADSYRIYRATLGVSVSAAVFETQEAWATNGLSFIDTRPVNTQPNAYAVKAMRSLAGANGWVEGALSAAVTVTPWVLPGAPGRYSSASSSSLAHITTVARPGGPGVDLSWRASDLGSTVLSGYRVYRGYAPSVLTLTAFVAGSITAYHDGTAPLPYSALWYGVQALDVSGYASALVTSTVGTAAAWGAPSGLAATVLTGGVRLAWALPALSGTYALSSYAVSRRWQAGGPEDLLADVTSTAFTDLSPDAGQGSQPSYFVRVRDAAGATGAAASLSVNLGGASPYSATPSAAVLGWAQVLSGSASPVLLQWRPNPEAQMVTAYEVWRDLSLLGVTPSLSFTDSTSVPGASHAYGVTAMNAYGRGLSNTVNVLLAPPQPGWLSLTSQVDASANTSAALHLSWQDLGAPVDVTGYLVYRASPASLGMAGAVLLGSTTQTSFVDEAPAVGVPVAYGVLSIVGGQASDSALAVTQAALPALSLPGAITGLSATASTGVQLGWDRESAAREYWVYRATYALANPPQPAALLTRTAAISYNDTGAPSSEAIHYAVAGANALGLGTAASLSITPLPGLPGNVWVAPSYSSPTPRVMLSWIAPSAPYLATGYTVYRATWAEGVFSTSQLAYTTLTAYTDAGIPASLTNTPLYYLVNSVALAERWSGVPVSVRVYDVPAVPQQLRAGGSANAVDLVWAAAPEAEGVDAIEVSVQVADPLDHSVVSLPGSATSYRKAGVGAGIGVSFSVRALSNGGEAASPWSATVTASANAAGVAPAPISFSATVGYREPVTSIARVVLSWAPVGVSSTVLIYRSSGPMALSLAAGGPASPYYLASAGGTATWLSDTAVVQGQAYGYAISAVSADGLPGGESAAVGAATVTPFNHSELVSLSATAGDERVDLQWSVPVYGGTYGLGASPFLLYRYKANSIPSFKALAPDTGFPVAFPLSSTAWTDTLGLLNDSSYFYYMSTVNSLGVESSQAQFPRLAAPLTSSAAAMVPQGPLRPPTNLTAVAGDRSVALRWVALYADAQRGAKFNVYRRPDPGEYSGALPELFQVGPDTGAFVNVSLVVQTLRDSPTSADPPQNLQRYCYTMAAVNGWGEGPKSAELCVTPFKPLQPPSGGELLGLEVIGKKDVKLQWAAALSLTPMEGGYAVAGYRVYRSQDGGNRYAMLSQVTLTAYVDSATTYGAAYLYRVVPLDAGGNEGLSYSLQTVVIPSADNAVLVFKNAFNPALGESVPVQFSLQQPGHAWVKVFTLNGEYVATLFDEDIPAASGDSPYLSQKLAWNGANSLGQTVASGVYLIHLEASGFRSNARVAVIK